jgi:hypothetical protein
LQDTIFDIPDSCKLPNWKGEDTEEAIIVPEKRANLIMNRTQRAFGFPGNVSLFLRVVFQK